MGKSVYKSDPDDDDDDDDDDDSRRLFGSACRTRTRHTWTISLLDDAECIANLPLRALYLASDEALS
jgi:hypothetical protein